MQGASNLESQRLDGVHHLASHDSALIPGSELVVTAPVMGSEERIAVGVLAEEKELQVRPHPCLVAECSETRHRPLQRRPWVPLEPTSVRPVDGTDDVGYLALPGKDTERMKVRAEQHVRFLHPKVCVHGGPVEQNAPLERLPELSASDLDAAHRPEDVGEHQAEIPHAP